MELVLKELGEESFIKDGTLRKRARECARIRFTKHYIVHDDNREVAYLAIDYVPGFDYIFLYELFIRKEDRGKGIGSELLSRVEKLAKELGYKKVMLHAESFDKNITKESIENWYKKRGYLPSGKIQNGLEKLL